MLFAAGCTIKGTIKETTDTTSNVTGTTSGRTWFTEDGLLHPEHKLTAFMALNQANVEQDLARGQGEYLSSLGALLGVTDADEPTFKSKAQDAFGSLASADQAARVEYLRTLAR
jgi:hypothetical protein